MEEAQGNENSASVSWGEKLENWYAIELTI